MGGGNKINVMTPHFLQPDHHRRQLLARHLLPFPEMTDLIVLAENAAEIAVAEEDGPGTGLTDQGGFLTKVRGITGHHRQATGPADPFLVLQPVYLAAPRAEAAFFKNRQTLRYSYRQLAGFVKSQIT